MLRLPSPSPAYGGGGGRPPQLHINGASPAYGGGGLPQHHESGAPPAYGGGGYPQIVLRLFRSSWEKLGGVGGSWGAKIRIFVGGKVEEE